MLIGYARVSSRLQETNLQLDALTAVGVTVIHQEKASSVGSRPELHACMSALKPGDVLVVYKLDRVARSLKDLLHILDKITAAGAAIRSLTEPIDTSSHMGMFVVQILGAVAQLERSMIRERAIAGQVAARTRGVVWGGRPRLLTDEELEQLIAMKETGWYTWAVLGDMYGISTKNIFKNLVRRKKKALGLSVPPVLGKYLSQSLH